MGAADIIPGVSGGTVAFMTGIYDEFLHSLKLVAHDVRGDLGRERERKTHERPSDSRGFQTVEARNAAGSRSLRAQVDTAFGLC